VFHDNPICAEGSLVFFDYGWDLLEHCCAAGFQDAYMLAYYSAIYGHIGRACSSASSRSADCLALDAFVRSRCLDRIASRTGFRANAQTCTARSGSLRSACQRR
jgi:hypothetical protein